MTYSLEYTPAASRQLHKLDKSAQARLKPKIKALSENPRMPGAIKLQGFENTYRLRVGDFRILYEIHDDILLVLIVEIGQRGKIYRRKK
ncbi:Plasmid stabilization system [Beggiatoa sp. PS]|nr:Plasmid stabilization system [Beggiatoa sp. PS]